MLVTPILLSVSQGCIAVKPMGNTVMWRVRQTFQDQ
jgi:hypothetical protein